MPTSSRSANMWRRQLVLLIAAAAAVTSTANAAVVKYDQSQTGDYNVHLDLKNVEVLAFLDDSSLNFGEYEYDYGDLTVKPPPPPTGDTLSVTSSETSPGISSTEKAPENGTTTGETVLIPSSTAKPNRRCGAGFYRDTMGRCRRQRRPIKLAGLINQAKNQVSG